MLLCGCFRRSLQTSQNVQIVGLGERSNSARQASDLCRPVHGTLDNSAIYPGFHGQLLLFVCGWSGIMHPTLWRLHSCNTGLGSREAYSFTERRLGGS